MPEDIQKRELFRRLGLGGDPASFERALEEAGLSRAGKARILLAKEDQVRDLLFSQFMPICQRDDCRTLAPGRASGRAIVPAATPTDCELCAGSINALAVEEMIGACERVGWRRLCIVGGSPNTTAELASLIGKSLQVRTIVGTMSRTRRDAEADVAWADRVVIWGSTELAHKVSALYKGPNVITVARRSVAELARAVKESAARAK